ncbi:MAG: hypothetical protein ACTS6J_10360 [Burkholderiales bacterium]
MAASLPLAYCKRRLAITWLIGAGLPFLLLVVQTLIGHYGDTAQQVWSWFLASVTPTIGLIVAVLATEALQQVAGDRPVDAFFYRLSLGLSIFYLLLIWLVLLITPVSPVGLPQMIQDSAAWLGAMQGFVTAALGVFYVKKK